MVRRIALIAGILLLAIPAGARAEKSQLFVGTATTDITPSEPVALAGQFNLRIARAVETPVTANVIALETRGADGDAAIMVSCDVVYIPADILALVREKVKKRLPDLDGRKIFLNATHTHTAPELVVDGYSIPAEGVMQVAAYREFFVGRVADAIERAWNGRKPGDVTWGLSHAAVACNRRAVYANGTARMYGATNVPQFRGMEGYEDHDVGTLFFHNAGGKLIAVAINVACPSQEVESRRAVNADYWHPVRQELRKQYGKDLCVLGWCGAAGDQSPHLMYRKAAEERMRKLRGLDRLEEIARRIVRAVDDAYAVVKQDRHSNVPLVHHVETITLPMRVVTEAEYKEAKAASDRAAAAIKADPKAADQEYRRMKWYGKVVERFEQQKTNPHPTYDMELHVVRLGDAVICTNSFELFTDYGIQIKARSKAVETFIIQLTGPGSYLPTQKAVRGGHYSAIVESNLVGPEGGQILVDRTVGAIDALFAEGK